MAEIKYIYNYEFDENDKFFLDANVWLYLYCSMGGYSEGLVKRYSDFFDRIKEEKKDIFINSGLVSEIFNRYLHIEFSAAKAENPDIDDYKKDFRDNKEFEETISMVKKIVKEKIVDPHILISDKFETFNCDNFFDKSDFLDFNDAIHCHTALENDLKIVTNDSDFKKTKLNVKIITY